MDLYVGDEVAAIRKRIDEKTAGETIMSSFSHQRNPDIIISTPGHRFHWSGVLALAALASLIVLMPPQTRADESEAIDDSAGAQIADEFFPDDPGSADFEDGGGPVYSDTDVNLNVIPDGHTVIEILESFVVGLENGQSEILRTINLNYLISNSLSLITAGIPEGTPPAFGVQFPVAVYDRNTDFQPFEVLIFVLEGKAAEDLLNQQTPANVDIGQSAVDEWLQSGDYSGGGMWQMGIDKVPYFTSGGETGYRGENVFRDLLFENLHTYTATIMLDRRRPMMSNAVFGVALQRRTTCLMNVSYAGDLSGTDFGDLAYYNNFLKEGNRFAQQGGVANATGSAVDEKVLLLLEAAVVGPGGIAYSNEEWQAIQGGAVDVFAEPGDAGTAPEDSAPPAGPMQSAQMREFEDFASGAEDVRSGKLRKSELETFGLSLAGRKPSRSIDPLTAFVRTATSVTLEAASRAKLDEFFASSPEPESGNTTFPMPLSRLALKTNQLFEDGTAAKFAWNEGDAGPRPILKIHKSKSTPGLVGEIEGTLTSENYRKDDGSKAQVTVTARFMAAEGALGCDFGTFR